MNMWLRCFLINRLVRLILQTTWSIDKSDGFIRKGKRLQFIATWISGYISLLVMLADIYICVCVCARLLFIRNIILKMVTEEIWDWWNSGVKDIHSWRGSIFYKKKQSLLIFSRMETCLYIHTFVVICFHAYVYCAFFKVLYVRLY